MAADPERAELQLPGQPADRPRAAYTYDIAYGGSGNRNKTVGDSIFHCHFYPHFAQGMWELWRVHDTFERGTVMDGVLPAADARALPDGEIDAGTPIPAVVPVPSMPMAPMPFAPDPDGDGPEGPTESTVVAVDLDGDGPGRPSAQVDLDADGTADVLETGFSSVDVPDNANPGYPFYIAAAAGHRPPTSPMDMADYNGGWKRHTGRVRRGIRRHIILGGTATSFVTPKDMNKIIDSAYVAYLPEDGYQKPRRRRQRWPSMRIRGTTPCCPTEAHLGQPDQGSRRMGCHPRRAYLTPTPAGQTRQLRPGSACRE